MVEPACASLTVEPAYASLSVEHLKVLSSSIYLFGGGAYGRAPKGDGGQSSLLSHPYQSSPLKGDGGDGGLNSRARNPSPYE